MDDAKGEKTAAKLNSMGFRSYQYYFRLFLKVLLEFDRFIISAFDDKVVMKNVITHKSLMEWYV